MDDFKGRHFTGEVILWAVRWYCRYGISYRDLEEMLAERGIDVDHTTIYRWVQRYAPEMEKRLRWFWRRGFDPSWRLDETYVKVRGKWTYLYRAVDKGATRSTSSSRRPAAPKPRSASGKGPSRAEGLGETNETQHRQGPQLRRRNRRVETRRKLALETEHRQVKYLNNVLEADHGKLKLLIKPVRGFKSMPTAYATIKGFEVMRALRKGQARAWCLQPGSGRGASDRKSIWHWPSVMTEAMDVLNQHFANAA
jgi:transposase-like protein